MQGFAAVHKFEENVLVGTDVAELCVFKAYFQRFDYLTLLI
jgi:hypothetical protein